MSRGSISLLDFLDAPVIVGDPDGRVVYVNPALAACTGVSAEGAKGRPLADLFEGGGREAVLRAVAGACKSGESVRFRLRASGIGYSALASPIKSNDDNVGVVILLGEELENDPRVLALNREIHEPLDEIARCLAELAEATGGLRSPRYRQAVEDAGRAVARVRKCAEQIQSILDVKG